jgi:hypothetical protein
MKYRILYSQEKKEIVNGLRKAIDSGSFIVEFWSERDYKGAQDQFNEYIRTGVIKTGIFCVDGVEYAIDRMEFFLRNVRSGKLSILITDYVDIIIVGARPAASLGLWVDEVDEKLEDRLLREFSAYFSNCGLVNVNSDTFEYYVQGIENIIWEI